MIHTRDVREYDYISRRLLQLLEYYYINARLRQRRAPPHDIISWLHRLSLNLAVRSDYSSPAARALRRPHRTPRLLVSGRTRSTSTSPCAATTRLRPHAPYVNLAMHRDYSSPLSRLQRSTSTTLRVRVPRLVVRLVTRLVALLIVDYSGLIVDYFTSAARPRCLDTSRGSSRGSSRRSSSTTPHRAGSSSTTSPTPRVRGASARRAARHAARRAARHRLRLTQARRQLVRLRHASGVPRQVAWLVTRLVTPLVVDYSASPRLVVDYSTARPGASARCAARHAARRATRRRLHRASECLGTSRGSSSTTSRRAVSSSTAPCAATSSCGHTGSTSATP
jgi:hypothetical protein